LGEGISFEEARKLQRKKAVGIPAEKRFRKMIAILLKAATKIEGKGGNSKRKEGHSVADES